MMPVLTLLTLLLTIGTVAWMFRFAASREALPQDLELPSQDEMKLHMLWGLFYINPADPRGTVPKTSGVGYTVNFRTERNARWFALLVVATLLSAAAQILYVLACFA